MKPLRKGSKQFETQQKFKVRHRPVIVPDLLLALVRQLRSPKELPDIFQAVNVWVLLNLGVIVIHESIRERISINQKCEKEQAPQQRSSLPFGGVVVCKAHPTSRSAKLSGQLRKTGRNPVTPKPLFASTVSTLERAILPVNGREHIGC
jgi:hypothetical protein